MPAATDISWPDLFRSGTPANLTLVLRVVKKSGRPFLFLPLPAALAAQSLSLYPAQSGLAKLAKSFLRAALQTGLPLGLEKISVPFSSRDPFPGFIAGLVESNSRGLPPLAVLAGNPRAEGCRYLILLFNQQGRPAIVVKAGLGDSARGLIRHETSFLNSAPPATPGLPSLRASFDAGQVSAFALDFVAGDSPKPEAWPALGELLSSWLNRAKEIQLHEVPAWQALEKTCAADPFFVQLSRKVANISFHPALFHGDLAPWNIKLSPHGQTWSVLDWERGALTGIPGWDWFHYLVQTGVLVGKLTPEELFGNIEGLFEHAAFRNYAGLAKINGHEQALLMGYLLHLIYVVGPSEGLETNKALLSLLAQRWLN